MNRTLSLALLVLLVLAGGFFSACSSGTPSAPASAAAAATETTLGADARNGVEISGTIARVAGSCPSLRFVVGRVTVQAARTTAFVGGTCANVVNGAAAVVRGSRERDGSLAASQITVRGTQTR